MRRLHPFLSLFVLLVCLLANGATTAPAAPPPPDAGASMVIPGTPTELTAFDVRFHAVAVDGAGTVFVAVPFPGSRVQICRLADSRLACFLALPGSKHASVSLAVLPSGSLLVTWSGRPDGAIEGPFPLYELEVPHIATPFPRFGSLIPQVQTG